jgi:hypothetical protein
LIHILSTGGSPSGSKHIPVGSAPQIPDTPASGIVQEFRYFGGVNERFTPGKGYRVDPVPEALANRFHYLRPGKLMPFYNGAFPHTALRTGGVTIVGNLDNQLSGKPAEEEAAKFL